MTDRPFSDAPPRALEPGEWIRDYQITGRFRAGGMATVFVARRYGAAGFSKKVAIKVVHPHLCADETFIRMFIDEALLCANINHPNVVHVEEFGEEAGLYFMVMEYVSGFSLRHALTVFRHSEIRLPVPLAVHIAIRSLEGLHAAHETLDENGEPLHVVHRDVTPSNIMLSRTGQVKVIDFGIAKSVAQLQVTEAKTFKGKIRYMAPEQALGKAVDARTDVYSLATVLWEVLAGRPLIEGEGNLAMLYAVRDPKTIPPSRYAPDLPPELDAAVMRALDSDPEKRPASARAFQEELAKAVPESGRVQPRELADFVRELPAPPELVAELSVGSGSLPSRASIGAAHSHVQSAPSFRPSGAVPRRSQGEEAPRAQDGPASPPNTPPSDAHWTSGRRARLLLGGGVALLTIVALLLIFGLQDDDPEDQAAQSPPSSAEPPSSTVEMEERAAEAPAEPEGHEAEAAAQVRHAVPDRAWNAGRDEPIEAAEAPQGDSQPSAKVRRRRWVRQQRAGQVPPASAASEAESGTEDVERESERVDGVLLAGEEEMEMDVPSRSRETSRVRSRRVGSTTIAEDFE